MSRSTFLINKIFFSGSSLHKRMVFDQQVCRTSPPFGVMKRFSGDYFTG
jgi:hypothetical protein